MTRFPRWAVPLFALLIAFGGCGTEADTGTTAVPVTAPIPVPTTTSTTALSTTTTVPARALVVPAGEAPMLDGTVGMDEWAGAVVTLMDDGTELHWLEADGSLYLGVVAADLGAVNLVIADAGQVRILHSSAALGSARYEPADEGWRLSDDFEWCCRSSSDVESLDLLFDTEGWTGTIGFAGETGHVEYRVAMHDAEYRVAVSYVYTADSVAFWPLDLDGSSQERLYGTRNEEEAFASEGWMALVLDG